MSQLPVGNSRGGRASIVVRRPCTFAGRGAGLVQRLADGPTTAPVGHGHQGVVRAQSRPRSPRRRGRPPAPRVARHLPRSRPAAKPLRDPGRLHHSHRTRRTRRRSIANRCTGKDARAGPARPPQCRRVPYPRCRRPSSRSTMPGVQKPHWLAPHATNASAHAVACLRGRALRPCAPRGPRPAARASRTPRGAGRRRARCSSRIGPAGCSRPSANAHRGRRAARRAAIDQTDTSTATPFTRSATRVPLSMGRRIGWPPVPRRTDQSLRSAADRCSRAAPRSPSSPPAAAVRPERQLLDQPALARARRRLARPDRQLRLRRQLSDQRHAATDDVSSSGPEERPPPTHRRN